MGVLWASRGRDSCICGTSFHLHPSTNSLAGKKTFLRFANPRVWESVFTWPWLIRWCVRRTRALCSPRDESVMLDKQDRDERAFRIPAYLYCLALSFCFVFPLSSVLVPRVDSAQFWLCVVIRFLQNSLSASSPLVPALSSYLLRTPLSDIRGLESRPMKMSKMRNIRRWNIWRSRSPGAVRVFSTSAVEL